MAYMSLDICRAGLVKDKPPRTNATIANPMNNALTNRSSSLSLAITKRAKIQRETGKPRQGVVANTLNLCCNEARLLAKAFGVGCSAWLDRSSSGFELH